MRIFASDYHKECRGVAGDGLVEGSTASLCCNCYGETLRSLPVGGRYRRGELPTAEQRDLGPPPVVTSGDARRLNLADCSIDLVLTSPPYLNAIDYMRCSKFSLVWMGYTVDELPDIRAKSVGTEASIKEAVNAPWVKALIRQLGLKPALSSRNQGLLATYVWDMSQALSEVSRVLRRGGRAVYVVGDSTSKGTFIRNSAIVSTVAQQHGLSLVFRQSRALPANRRYMPPPKRGVSGATMDGRIRYEVVVRVVTKH